MCEQDREAYWCTSEGVVAYKKAHKRKHAFGVFSTLYNSVIKRTMLLISTGFLFLLCAFWSMPAIAPLLLYRFEEVYAMFTPRANKVIWQSVTLVYVTANLTNVALFLCVWLWLNVCVIVCIRHSWLVCTAH